MGNSGFTVADKIAGSISPPIKTPPENKNYGAILSATVETAQEVLEVAIKMRKCTGKPVMLIIGGEDGAESEK